MTEDRPPAPGGAGAAEAEHAQLARRLYRLVGRAGALPAAVVEAALEPFMARPAPSTFLGAARALEQGRRRAQLVRHGAAVLQRSFDDGVSALGEVPGVPAALVRALARGLPVEPRAGDRLRALAALALAYEQLATRVAADLEVRRRLFQSFPQRRQVRRGPTTS
jgi:hypothetical protein